MAWGTGNEVAATDKPSESPTSVGLPTVDFGPEGPLVIQGYPKPLSLGMQDFANLVGYTNDGSEAIACGIMTPLGPVSNAAPLRADVCFSSGKEGGTVRLLGLSDDNMGGYRVTDSMKKKLDALDAGKRVALRRDNDGTELYPPALSVSWPFAKDISLAVVKSPRADYGEDLRIGGAVKGEKQVFPVGVHVAATSDLPYRGEWNAIIPNPDRTELAFMAHFTCMEWCSEMVILRMTFGKIASHIFNDTGFGHHQKKDYEGSRDLFLKATWADPRAPLPPYNLACAYALLKDEANATKALKLAIAVAGDKVKARAKADADFQGVKNAAWFRELTN